MTEIIVYGLWIILGIVAILLLSSFVSIGPTEVGLVMKRFSYKKLPSDNPVAFLILTSEKVLFSESISRYRFMLPTPRPLK